MFTEWQIEAYDHHAFVKQSIENFMRGFSDRPNFINDFQALNPFGNAVDPMEQVNARKAELEAEGHAHFSEPVVWSPF